MIWSRILEQGVEVGNLAQVDLRAGQKGLDAEQVDHDAALDAAGDGAEHQLLALEGLADALPHAHEVGALLGEDDLALVVLDLVEVDLDLGAGNQLRLVAELGLLDHALGLEADVDEDVVAGDADDAALDDAAFLVAAERAGVLREQGGARLFGETGLDLEVLEIFLGAVDQFIRCSHGILPAGNGLIPRTFGEGCSLADARRGPDLGQIPPDKGANGSNLLIHC
jgi:hypothetical protein